MVARVIRINNLTLKYLYHPRHTCITLDYVSGNTGVPWVIQILVSDISPYHPGNHVITDNITYVIFSRTTLTNHKLLKHTFRTTIPPLTLREHNRRVVNADKYKCGVFWVRLLLQVFH